MGRGPDGAAPRALYTGRTRHGAKALRNGYAATLSCRGKEGPLTGALTLSGAPSSSPCTRRPRLSDSADALRLELDGATTDGQHCLERHCNRGIAVVNNLTDAAASGLAGWWPARVITKHDIERVAV